MSLEKPACPGIEVMDMRYIDLGLKGDDETARTICREVLSADSNLQGEIIVTLSVLSCLSPSLFGFLDGKGY
jgi:hypothetical protein